MKPEEQGQEEPENILLLKGGQEVQPVDNPTQRFGQEYLHPSHRSPLGNGLSDGQTV